MHLIYSIFISLILLNHHIIVSDENFKIAFAMIKATLFFKDSHLFAMPQI